MKIIGIGRNYEKHIQELNNKKPLQPLFFLMPDSALLLKNQDFYYPNFTKKIDYELELVIKICKVGKNIEEKFASRYFNELALGIDFTARDIQQMAKKNGLPWTLAKGFDFSCPLSEFISVKEFTDIQNINISLEKNSQIVQKSSTNKMIFSVNYIISYISKFITLKIGDLIFTGTPEGVGEIKIGDNLKAYINEKKMLDFNIK